ncbi:MAG: efflux RND transporter periplasmic adaptor subunit [Anaerolineales bacterium]
MQHKRPPVPAIILVVLIIAAGIYYGFQALNGDGNGQLSASGTIESVVVNVSPEMAGKVKEVLVSEGQSVKTGDTLLSLDNSLLAAQRVAAAAQLDSANAAVVTADAALASAQHQYDLAYVSAITAEQNTQASDWRFSAPDEFNQPSWYFIQPEQLASAQVEVDAAQSAFERTLTNLQEVTGSQGSDIFLAAEKRLSDARATFLVADKVKINAEYAAEGGGLLDAAYDSYNEALDEVRIAQREYNALLNTQAARDVQDARGMVVVAQQRYDQAQTYLLGLKTGGYSPAVVTAEKNLEQAKAAAEQAHIATSQAQANLELLDTQISKLTVYAPMDGVVLVRNVEPGEFVQPGATALNMADLNNLTITVYVPEDRYGQINIGQQAEVSVDSFPNTTFKAEITQIADQAEFTPRNVQTVEGRSSTVYAVKLKVTDSNGKLKIGMPADVVFVN